jgi:hypothetical protein
MGDYYKIIVDGEWILTKDAEETYGEYFKHTKESLSLFLEFIKEIDPKATTFVRFFSQVQNHAILALLSIVRKHDVQAGMNIRQMIEHSRLAVYALYYDDESNFYCRDDRGVAHQRGKVVSKARAFLDKNFKEESSVLKKTKA